MAIQFGRNAYVLISDAEGTYGDTSTVSYSVWSKIYTCTLSKSVERTQKTFLTTSDAGFSRGKFDVQTNCGGEVEIPLLYNGIGMWLYYAMGSKGTSGSSAPYTHTYSPVIPLPSFGAKFQRGSGSSEEFKGCMVSTMTISCAAGEEAKVSMDIIAQDAAARAAALGAPTFGSGAQAFHYQARSKALKFTPSGGSPVEFTLRSFEYKLDNKLDTRYKLGSLLTESPDTNDIREIMLSCVADLEDNTIYNYQIDGTEGEVEIHFTSGSDTITIKVFNACLLSYEDNVTSVGRLERSFEFQGYASSSTEATTITIVNSDPSDTSNG
tara:strand:- start:4961 stop:5932 length:972 start_codon:yes stop_codon:yes gene_type:complete